MMPRASHPLVLVHPDPASAPVAAPGNANAPPGVRMRDIPGAPGTRLGLTQACLMAAALDAMASTSDFASVTAFRCVLH